LNRTQIDHYILFTLYIRKLKFSTFSLLSKIIVQYFIGCIKFFGLTNDRLVNDFVCLSGTVLGDYLLLQINLLKEIQEG
jgi:hypothetical protein